jgi:hypothetical protein
MKKTPKTLRLTGVVRVSGEIARRPRQTLVEAAPFVSKREMHEFAARYVTHRLEDLEPLADVRSRRFVPVK